MYLVTTAHTGLKEFYQEYEFIDAKGDLDIKFMTENLTPRTIKINDLAALTPLLIAALGAKRCVRVSADAEGLSNYVEGRDNCHDTQINLVSRSGLILFMVMEC